LFLTILNIILPVIFVIFIGYLWNIYNKDFNIVAVTKLVSNIALPCLIYDSITRANLTINIFFEIFFSAFLVLSLGFLFGYIFIKIFKLPSIKLTTPIMHPNSGNMGLPLALLTFGSEGLALAAGFASIVMVSHFTANSAISSGNYLVYLLNLDGIVAKVVILQSTMPAAILTYLIASENNSYDQEIGAAVFVSTVASIISIPVILFFLI